MIDEIVVDKNKKIYTLKTECIIHLHDLLSKNYHMIDKMDPVEPPGIKNINSLESAVFRQHTGSGSWYKYNTVFENCATLVFALINNHAFHNGNKRVAFLAMIKHLFENGYVILPSTKHDNIYQLLVAIADNKLSGLIYRVDKKLYRKYKQKDEWSDELIIEVMSQWLRKNAVYKDVSIKINIKINKIRDMLATKGISVEQNGTWLKLYQVRKKKILGITSNISERYNEQNYGIGNSMSEVGIKVINQIRKDYKLTQSDGFDNNLFYDGDAFIDQEMLNYKKIIYKLSLT